MEIKEETLRISQIRNMDKYEVVHNVKNEMSGKEVKEVYAQITGTISTLEKNLEKLKKDIVEAPLKMQNQIEQIEKEINLLKKREQKFNEIASTIKVEEPKESDGESFGIESPAIGL